MTTAPSHAKDPQVKKSAPERKSAAPVRGAMDSISFKGITAVIENPDVARPEEILQLQRLAGNRAVTHLLQTKTGVERDDETLQPKLHSATLSPALDSASGAQPSAGALTPLGPAAKGVETVKPAAATMAPAKVDSPKLNIQPKLMVSQPGDQQEVEADQVSEQIMKMPGRATPPPPNDDENKNNNQNRPVILNRYLQRQQIQRASDGIGGNAVSDDVQGRIESMHKGGRPLPTSEREFFEPRMGVDLGNVRIHTDGEATETSKELNARAYTVGPHVAFNSGEFQPGTTEGRKLLGHELTHVVQQGGAKELPQQDVAPEKSAKVAADSPATKNATPDSSAVKDAAVAPTTEAAKPATQAQSQKTDIGSAPTAVVASSSTETSGSDLATSVEPTDEVGSPIKATTPEKSAAAVSDRPTADVDGQASGIADAIQGDLIDLRANGASIAKNNIAEVVLNVQPPTTAPTAPPPAADKVLDDVKSQVTPEKALAGSSSGADASPAAQNSPVSATESKTDTAITAPPAQSETAAAPSAKSATSSDTPSAPSTGPSAPSATPQTKAPMVQTKRISRVSGPQIQRDVDLNPFGGLIDSLKKRATEAGNRIREGANSAVHGLIEKGSNGISSVTSQLAEARDALQARGTQLWDELQSNAAAARDRLTNQATTAWEALQDQREAATENLRSTAESAWAGLQTQASNATTALQNSSSALSDKLGSAAKGAVDFISSGWDNLKEKATTLVDNVKEQASGFIDGLKEQVKNVGGGLWQGLTGLQNLSDKLMEGLQNTAKGLLGGVQGKLGGLANAILNFDGAAVASAWEGVKSLVGNVWQNLQAAGGQVLSTLQNTWDTLSKGSSQLFAGVGEKAKGFVKNLGSMAQNAWTGVQGMWSNLKDGATNALSNMAGMAQSGLDNLKQMGATAWNGLKEAGSAAWNNLQSLGTAAWTGLQTAGTAAWNNLKALGTEAWTGLQNAGNAAWSTLQGLGNTAWNGLKQFGTTLWTGLKGDSEAAESDKRGEQRSEENGIQGLAGKIMNMLGSILGGLRNVAGPAIDNLVSKAGDAWNGLKEQATSAWTGLQTFATDAWNGLKTNAANAWTSLQGFATSAWTGLQGMATDAWNGLKSVATDAWTNLKGMATSAWNTLKNTAAAIGQKALDVWESLKEMGSQALEGAKQAWNGFTTFLGNAWDGVKNFASNAWEGLKQTATDIWQNVQNGWESLKKWASEKGKGFLDKINQAFDAIKSFSIETLIEILKKVGPFIKALKDAIANPSSVTDPIVNAITSMLQKLPSEAKKQTEKIVGGQKPELNASQSSASSGRVMRTPADNNTSQKERRTRTPEPLIYLGIGATILEQLLAIDLGKMAQQVIDDLIRPWEGTGKDLNQLKIDISAKINMFFAIESFDDFFTNISHLMDIPLILWRSINSILSHWYGWFFIASIIVGGAAGAVAGAGIGGTFGTICGFIAGFGVGAAPGAAGGGISGAIFGAAAGAGAGAAFAGTVGLYLLGSFALAEGLSAQKGIDDLKYIPQTTQEKTEDFIQVSSSIIGIAVAAILFVLSAVAARLGTLIMNAAKSLIPKSLASLIESFSAGYRNRWNQIWGGNNNTTGNNTNSQGNDEINNANGNASGNKQVANLVDDGNQNGTTATQNGAKETGTSGTKTTGNNATTNNIPDKAINTAKYAQENGGNAQSGYRGNTPFTNDGRGGGQVLPTQDTSGNPITYTEYDVNPYQQGVNRGLERVVIGSDGSCYYTIDHYHTFIKFR